MKNIHSYKSLMVAGILLALTALQGLNYYNYNRYNETIFKIQTVDFNIMSQILPTKLSTALIHNDARAITESISNSNFSLFGIALTDCISESPECSEQKITHANWKHLLHVNPIKLSGQHYDVLRDPPPLHAEKRYPNFSGINPKAVSLPNNNHGKIIGRVYYIRKLPDSFIDSQIYWLKSILDFKFNDRYTYTNNFVFTVFIFGIAFLIALKIRRQDKALNEALLREAEFHRKAEEFHRISAENKLLRLVSFNSTLSHVIDQEFSSVVANQLQKIDASIREIMLRTHVDIKDIIHDINKAPLLASAGSTDELLARITSQNTDSGIPPELTDFISDVISSIKTIQWVLNDLKDIASLDSTLMDINTALDDFKGKLPPTLTGQDWLEPVSDLTA